MRKKEKHMRATVFRGPFDRPCPHYEKVSLRNHPSLQGEIVSS